MLNNLFLSTANKMLTAPQHRSKFTQVIDKHMIDKATIVMNDGSKLIDMDVFTAERTKFGTAMAAGTLLLSLIGSKIAVNLANKNS